MRSPVTRYSRLRARAAALVVVGIAAAGGVLAAAGPAEAAPPAGSAVGTKADDGAVVIGENWLDDRTVDITVRSPSVPDRVLPVRLLLPAGWQYQTTKTWPLTVLLHGGLDDYSAWYLKSQVSTLSASWDTIVAMPEEGNATFVNYYNNGKGGPPAWETWNTVELLQILSRGYHAGDARAVAGISSGGYGAMLYAAHHPGMFKYAASYSGATSIRLPALRWLWYSAALDQDPSLRYGLPYLNEDVWKAQDPAYLAKNLKGTGLYVSSGYTGIPTEEDTVAWTPEQFALEGSSGIANTDFVNQLKLNKIPVTSHFYAFGEHQWVQWRREFGLSWPLMMKAIGATQN